MSNSIPPRDRSREFYTPEDFSERTFFDAFADAFTWPEDLPLHKTDYGSAARARDMWRIGDDFRKAIGVVMKDRESD